MHPARRLRGARPAPHAHVASCTLAWAPGLGVFYYQLFLLHLAAGSWQLHSSVHTASAYHIAVRSLYTEHCCMPQTKTTLAHEHVLNMIIYAYDAQIICKTYI